jgi:hypothetical protein
MTEPNGEAGNRAGSGLLLARIAAAENRGMPPVRKPGDPELRFRVHQPEAENMLAGIRQFTAAARLCIATAEISLLSVDVKPTGSSLITAIFEMPVRAGAGHSPAGWAGPRHCRTVAAPGRTVCRTSDR